MLNIFLLDFYSRLRAWHQHKEDLKEADVETICVEVDRFWQRCPMSTRYLHPDEIGSWPDPWNLLNDNTYCLYGRALGILYTLMLLGIKEVDLIDGIDDNDESVVLILVDNAKYIMNWCPESVLNTNLTAFKNIRYLNTDPLVKKIGK